MLNAMCSCWQRHRQRCMTPTPALPYLEVVVGRQHGDSCVQLLVVQDFIGHLLPHESFHSRTSCARASAGRGSAPGRRGMRDQSARGWERVGLTRVSRMFYESALYAYCVIIASKVFAYKTPERRRSAGPRVAGPSAAIPRPFD